MAEPYSANLIQNLNHLTELLAAEEPIAETLRRVAELASKTIENCDAAGVTLVDKGKGRTAAATNDFTLKIDEAQYANEEGPCLAAFRNQEVVIVDDIETDGRWPAFAAAAARDGLASSLSLPVTVRDSGEGSLNIYSRAKGAFGQESAAVGKLFASQASVALLNAQIYAASLKLSEQLREAIKSREVIGKAKGMLIAKKGVSDDEAFEILKRVSQNENVKVRDIAQRIVDDPSSL